MSLSPFAALDLLHRELMVLRDRGVDLSSLSDVEISRECGLELEVIERGMRSLRARIEGFLQNAERRLFERYRDDLSRLEDFSFVVAELNGLLTDLPPVRGDWVLKAMEIHAWRASRTSPCFYEEFWNRFLPRVRGMKSYDEREEAERLYWEARVNRTRHNIPGKGWRKADEETPRMSCGRPRLCVVFDEPHGLFSIAWWVGPTGQWWFPDSSDQIDVTHWTPVPTPPGGWP